MSIAPSALPHLASPGPSVYFPSMPILWDSPLTAAVAQELHGTLSGAYLRGHTFHWDRRELRLHFRDWTLTWALDPGSGWVTLSDAQDADHGFRPLSAILKEVTAPPDERWMALRFQKRRGRTRRVEVIIELMTHQWNGILVEGPERWIRHLLWTRHLRDRDLAVGQAYRPPAPSERLGIDASYSRDELTALMERLLQEEGEEGILTRIAFTSPLNLSSLLHPLGKKDSGAPSVDHDLWVRLGSPDDADPQLLETPQGKQPYPFPLPSFQSSATESVLAGFQACLQEKAPEGDPSSRAAIRLQQALHQVRGRIRGLQRELDQVDNPALIREKANLLLARLGEVEHGTETVRLRGFTGEDVLVQLDPSVSPLENAQILYEEAARQERALERLPKLLKKARKREATLEALHRQMEDGTVQPEEVESRLPERRSRKRSGRTPPQPRLPYRTFTSSGGLEIRVGRGPRDNDALTFRHAAPEDIWLHARGTSGAHVVLRWSRSETPPARDLQEAAVLAALHSSARHAGVVPVDWTWRKYVRKPRKAPAGAVAPERVKTLFVKPEPDLPRRLEEEES